MTTLLFANTLVFFLLCMIWTRKDWFNFMLKFGFLCLGAGNLLAWLLAAGFVVNHS